MATLPGLTLWHEGQADGRETFVPVFLSRRPDERLVASLAEWYHRLWECAALVRRGDWILREVHGWPDNTTAERLVAWTWVEADTLTLVVVNLGDAPADGVVTLDSDLVAGRDWLFTDLLDGATYQRSGDDVAKRGLYVARPGWGAHVLQVTPATADAPGRTQAEGEHD